MNYFGTILALHKHHCCTRTSWPQTIERQCNIPGTRVFGTNANSLWVYVWQAPVNQHYPSHTSALIRLLFKQWLNRWWWPLTHKQTVVLFGEQGLCRCPRGGCIVFFVKHTVTCQEDRKQMPDDRFLEMENLWKYIESEWKVPSHAPFGYQPSCRRFRCDRRVTRNLQHRSTSKCPLILEIPDTRTWQWITNTNHIANIDPKHVVRLCDIIPPGVGFVIARKSWIPLWTRDPRTIDVHCVPGPGAVPGKSVGPRNLFLATKMIVNQVRERSNVNKPQSNVVFAGNAPLCKREVNWFLEPCFCRLVHVNIQEACKFLESSHTWNFLLCCLFAALSNFRSAQWSLMTRSRWDMRHVCNILFAFKSQAKLWCAAQSSRCMSWSLDSHESNAGFVICLELLLPALLNNEPWNSSIIHFDWKPFRRSRINSHSAALAGSECAALRTGD